MLIAARESFAAAARKRLPYDARVAYLQSTGTQWIDTGVLPTQNSVVRVSGEMTTTSYTPGVTYGVFGCRDSSYQKYVGAQVYNGSIIASFKNASVNPGDNTDRCYASLALGFFSAVVSKAVREIAIGRGRYAVSSPTYCENFQASRSIHLWGYNGAGWQVWPCRINSFAVDGVCDMIPVRVGSVGFMYDRISGRLFGNAGTGDFVVGADLPYDAEVEYLESTGTQWIDTGCNADNDLFYELQMSATQTSAQRMGAIVLSPSIIRHHCSMPERGDLITSVGYGTQAPSADGVAGVGIHTVSINRSGSVVELWIDGTRFNMVDYSAFDLARNFYLFARNGGGTVNYGSMRIYSAAFYRMTTLTRCYIPVRVGTTGYMYDRVSGQLFANAGTGSFVIGPDKTA